GLEHQQQAGTPAPGVAPEVVVPGQLALEGRRPVGGEERVRAHSVATFFAGVIPLRSSSSSITLARVAKGTAPEMKRPLTNIAGVPETPARWPSVRSVATCAAYLPESTQASKAAASRPSAAALLLSWATSSSR